MPLQNNWHQTFLSDLVDVRVRQGGIEPGNCGLCTVNVDDFAESDMKLAVDLMIQYVKLVRKYGDSVPVCIDSSDDATFEDQVTLTWNNSGRYMDRWVRLKVTSENSVFLKDMDEFEVPIAHAEGRIAVKEDSVLDELRAAVVRRDLKRLQSIPGIGKKTAERVLLELRDKMGVDETNQPAAGADDGADLPALDADAVSALTNLGYSHQLASRAVGRAVDSRPDAGLEIILKEALAGIVR